MNVRKALSHEEVTLRLGAHPNWRQEAGVLASDFVFGDFREAFSFMTKAALISERLDHHPEWTNIYNRVSIRLSTHSAGGITELDFAWLEALER